LDKKKTKVVDIKSGKGKGKPKPVGMNVVSESGTKIISQGEIEEVSTDLIPVPKKPRVKKEDEPIAGNLPLPATGQIMAGSAPTGPGQKSKAHTRLVISYDLANLPLIQQNEAGLLKWQKAVLKMFDDGVIHYGLWDSFDIDMGAGSTRLAWAEVDHKEPKESKVKAKGGKRIKPDALLTLLAQAGGVYKVDNGEPSLPSELLTDSTAQKALEGSFMQIVKSLIAAAKAKDDQDSLRILGQLASVAASAGEILGAWDLLRSLLHEQRTPAKDDEDRGDFGDADGKMVDPFGF
jgi:hypothetical protein